MSKIQTYQEMLLLEKQLETNLVSQAELIRKDIIQLKAECGPIITLLSGLGRVTSTVKTHPLLSIGLGLAADLLQKNLAVAGGGMITRLVLPFLVRNFSPGGGSGLKKIIDKFRH
jgi:hypothetical protein